MLHPHTELRFVSQEIGYGIFATQDIPVGTITWVKDELDREFKHSEVAAMTEFNRENLLKYTYRNRLGDYFFCWDLTRYVNHSYEPNSMLTSMDFEIAIKNIKKGDELTNDYGTLNIIEAFQCANGPHEREFVRPDDLKRYSIKWDQLITSAMEFQPKVNQPLNRFLTKKQHSTLADIHARNIRVPSILENYFIER
jgi:hypothetical protein